MKYLIGGFCLLASAQGALACSTQATGPGTMAIQAPCSPTVVTYNQKTAPGLMNIAIADADAKVAGGMLPMQVQAPGLVNVEVWTHGTLAVRLVDDGTGTFKGNLDLSKEPIGPIVLGIFAWDKPPGDNTYTINLASKMVLMVNSAAPPPPPPPAVNNNLVISGTPAPGNTLTASQTVSYQWYNDGRIINGQTGATYNVIPPDVGHTLTVGRVDVNDLSAGVAVTAPSIVAPKASATVLPAGAAGMTLKWSDEFNSLNAGSCKPSTGTWPACTAPTAADGFTWYENKPGGGDFGNAANEHTDSAKYNPFTISNGFLRIRSTYDPNYTDPYGFKRHWYAGQLATGFNDGTTSVPMSNGYYEARILIPVADASYNKNASGGTWPSWWMLTANNLVKGSTSGQLEEDIMEAYGNDPLYTQTGQHVYSPATGSGVGIYSGHPDGDLTWDFHRFGMLISDTTLTAYLDDKVLGTLARGNLANGVPPQWFVILELAAGGGWPVNPPPAGYFDMWIDYARYYSP